MGTIDDVRKVIQDLVAPELKALASEVRRIESESKTRDKLILTKLDAFAAESRSRDELILAKSDSNAARMEAMGAKLDFQYSSIMNALNLDKRVESLERDRQSASA